MGKRMPIWLAVVLLVLAGAGTFVVGRATAARPEPDARGYPAGYAEGLLEGRAEQATLNLPATDKAVFRSGYEAGEADVFAGYDGGWDRGAPYVIVLVPGGVGIAYRIGSRMLLEPGNYYYLCPDGHPVCRQPR